MNANAPLILELLFKAYLGNTNEYLVTGLCIWAADYHILFLSASQFG